MSKRETVTKPYTPLTALVHFEMSLEELKTSRVGGYTDPDRYKPGHRDYNPEMLCHTGQFRAKGARNRAAVTCPACLEALRLGAPGLSDYVRRKRAELGDDFENMLRFIEPRGVVFIITQHVSRSKVRTFLPVVFFRHGSDGAPEMHETSPGQWWEVTCTPARDKFPIGKRACQVLGWRWDSKHIGWIEEPGGGQTALHAVRELSRVLFNDPDSLVAVEV